MPLFQFSDAHPKFFKEAGTCIEYRIGQVLTWPPDDSMWAYYVERGAIKVSCFYKDGSENIEGILDKGLSFVQGGSRYNFIAGEGLQFIAIEPTVVYRVAINDFMEQLNRDRVFSSDYITMLQRDHLVLLDKVTYMGDNNLETRFIRWLIYMAKYFGEPTGMNDRSVRIAMKLTQETMAAFLGITRESVGKYYRQMKAKGLITVEKKIITVVDTDSLRKMTD